MLRVFEIYSPAKEAHLRSEQKLSARDKTEQTWIVIMIAFTCKR